MTVLSNKIILLSRAKASYEITNYEQLKRKSHC